jgi:hypothetical protein
MPTHLRPTSARGPPDAVCSPEQDGHLSRRASWGQPYWRASTQPNPPAKQTVKNRAAGLLDGRPKALVTDMQTLQSATAEDATAPASLRLGERTRNLITEAAIRLGEKGATLCLISPRPNDRPSAQGWSRNLLGCLKTNIDHTANAPRRLDDMSNPREPTIGIVCEQCGPCGCDSVERLIRGHGDAKMTDLLAALADRPRHARSRIMTAAMRATTGGEHPPAGRGAIKYPAHAVPQLGGRGEGA